MKKKDLKTIAFKMKTIPIKNQRYKSIDDWFDPEIIRDVTTGQEELLFTALTANTGNRKYNFLVLIHALVEQYLCFEHNIEDKEVTEFDLSHIKHENPGELEDAPYHKEHIIANDVEAILANALNVNWIEYEKTIDKTLKKYKVNTLLKKLTDKLGKVHLSCTVISKPDHDCPAHPKKKGDDKK